MVAKTTQWELELAQACILAAGSSRRLKSLTLNTPKCLLEVGGVPLLEIHLKHLSELKIPDIWIIVGYLKELVKHRYGSRFGNLRIRYIENSHYDTKGHGYSLYLAREVFRRDTTVLIHADLYCDPSLYSVALNSSFENVLLIDRSAKPRWGDEFMVATQGRRVVEISHGHKEKTGGQYIGLARFNSEFLIDWCGYAASLVQRPDRELNYEIILNEYLQDQKATLNFIDITGKTWVNINYHRDLEMARSVAGAKPFSVHKVAAQSNTNGLE